MGRKEQQPDRFFSWAQKIAHAFLYGWQCEWFVEKGHRCESKAYLEADHVQPYSKGGKTEEDNLLLLCPTHHAQKHQLDEEPRAATLIRQRIKRK